MPCAYAEASPTPCLTAGIHHALTHQAANGYRLMALWSDGVPVALVGFRLQENLFHRSIYILIPCGGGFDAARGGQTDFMTPYLRCVLGTMGLKKVDIFRLDNMLRGDTAAADGHARAEAWIDGQLSRGSR